MTTMHTVQGTCTIHHGEIPNLDFARQFAETSAALGHTQLVRVWEGGRFLTSFSVAAGKCSEHADATIPAIHWGTR